MYLDLGLVVYFMNIFDLNYFHGNYFKLDPLPDLPPRGKVQKNLSPLGEMRKGVFAIKK